MLGRSGDLTSVKQAVDILQALIDDLPADNPLVVTARELLIRSLLVTGRADRASAVAGIAALRGNNLAAIALYAETLLQSRQFAAALAQGKRLEQLDPGNPFLTDLRVRTIVGRSKPTEAAAALETAYLERENSADAEPFGRAVWPLIRGMGPDALGVAERLGHRLAEHNPALSWMPASILNSRGKQDLALALCRTAVETGNQPADLCEACQIALMAAVASTDQARALEHARQILETAVRRAVPVSDDLLLMQAMLEHFQRRFDEEVRLYRRVLANQPRNTEVLNNLAWALSERLNQPSEALERINEQIAIVGLNADNRDTRGTILIRLGRLEEGVKDLEQSVKAGSNLTRLFHLAKAYKRMGRNDEFRKTCKALEEVQRSDPTNTVFVDPTERAEFEALLKL